MITKKKNDDYNYMLKASEGIILIKPEDNFKKHEDNKNYRNIEDIIYNIDDICDNCEIIGIGVNPHTKEVFNSNALAYPFLEEVLEYINKKYINIQVIISATSESINKSTFLEKYTNILLSVDLYNTQEIIKNNFLNIDCFYVPYPQDPQINFDELDLFYPNIYCFYCCEKRSKIEYLNYIDELNKRNNIPFISLENVYKEIYCKILKVLNEEKVLFKVNDNILTINNKVKAISNNILYNNLLKTNNFEILRNNKKISIECNNFLNNIILTKNLEENFDYLRILLEENKENSLILYTDYNYDIFIVKLNNLFMSGNCAPIITNDIFEEKNITLEDCKNSLELYRKNCPNKLITTLYIPMRIIKNALNKGSNISVEEFQQDTMTYIKGF